jgi:DEAD/DEAH box helicase domain-containing protein
MIGLFPLFALCDRGDVGGISYTFHPQVGRPAIFLYDGYPEGIGLAERCYHVLEDLMGQTLRLLQDCPCELGCPSCIHSPKCGSGNKPLDKEGALLLTRALLGREDLTAASLEEEVITPAPAIIAPQPKDELRWGVLDLETQRLAQEVGGWNNSHLMRVSVAVLYDSQSDSFTAFTEKEMPRLLERLTQLEMVVGFNIKRFDYAVLSAYSPRDLSKLPTLDLLEDVSAALGHRLSLQALGEATLDAGKSADGLQAVAWWRAGQMEPLTAYCRQDVELTRDLFLFGQRESHLLFNRKDGARLRVPVDWSWASLRRRLA